MISCGFGALVNRRLQVQKSGLVIWILVGCVTSRTLLCSRFITHSRFFAISTQKRLKPKLHMRVYVSNFWRHTACSKEIYLASPLPYAVQRRMHLLPFI